eukprot:1434473-Prymnesium_polylepis.1
MVTGAVGGSGGGLQGEAGGSGGGGWKQISRPMFDVGLSSVLNRMRPSFGTTPSVPAAWARELDVKGDDRRWHGRHVSQGATYARFPRSGVPRGVVRRLHAAARDYASAGRHHDRGGRGGREGGDNA